MGTQEAFQDDNTCAAASMNNAQGEHLISQTAQINAVLWMTCSLTCRQTAQMDHGQQANYGAAMRLPW